jgi:hypothetical protein
MNSDEKIIVDDNSRSLTTPTTESDQYIQSLESEPAVFPAALIPSVKSPLQEDYEKNKCNITENQYTKECNQFLLKKEFIEHDYLEQHPEENNILYPTLNDPNFNIKIAEKKEFNDTQYYGTIHGDIKEYADIMSNAELEMFPHQIFVRNFLSFQTPYNSLLLFHGLGSGKTLSSIGVSEEMRSYLKQMGISKRIIIVASPNVQDNFRLQLFDERKLKLVNGLWTIPGIMGSRLLKEINPTNTINLPRNKIISQIHSLINTSYLFLGYDGFANYIIKKAQGNEDFDKLTMTKIKRNLQNEFNKRLVVIDEIHNIRVSEDNKNKKVAEQLLKLVKYVDNLRLLLLTANPMYNDYSEIIWLLNLMNANDNRGLIEIKDVFDKKGNFKQGGQELLIRKATGYVSFVRGDNPYTFPFRIYPNIFSPRHTFLNSENKYPTIQMNGKLIQRDDQLSILNNQIYLVKVGSYQSLGYKIIIDNLRKKNMNITTKKGEVREMPNFENMEAFGYAMLQKPLEALIIVYPTENLEEYAKILTDASSIESELEDSSIPIYSDDESESESTKSSIPIYSDDESLTSNKIKYSNEEKEENKNSSEVIPTDAVLVESFPEIYSKKSPLYESSHEFIKPVTEEKITPVSLSSLEDVSPIDIEEFENIKVEPAIIKEELKSDDSSDVSIKSLGGGAGEEEEEEGILDISKIIPLTGKAGLASCMDFIDTKSPPEKGSFSYKSEKYGRIFSQHEIGKYSSKIKNICECVMKSTGIVLIYSEFLDGALIPMALALEELGFSRVSGGKRKSLFKDPPSIIKSQNFRYAMITGDPRISPDNNEEVKLVTNNDNINGDKVKVILISKAGSEGVDFKFIRQVHILEPWYNMNRIEQIFGRAVRNLSHKSLPFEKRNVEIYLYGSLLDKSSEESADLYVYRVAIRKAIQMGRITRILKETAIDCILNHEQINFTQENMNTEVDIILSDNTLIKNFKVGDIPGTASCDYMNTCNFQCRPNKVITNENIIEDSYDEAFIMINSDKIIQKIRMLMKDCFFYKKNELISRINFPKQYPIVQIYAALTQLVEDDNEIIIDKYGRNGHLINLGDYYIFQPSELTYPENSIFDNAVPVDFKNEEIRFKIKDNIKTAPIKQSQVSQASQPSQIIELSESMKETLGKRELPIEDVLETKKMKEMTELTELTEFTELTEMKENYNKALQAMSETFNEKIQDDWYKNCGVAMRKLVTEEKISKETMIHLLVEHIVDSLPFDKKVLFLNHLFSLDIIPEKSFEEYAKQYIDEKIIQHNGLVGILLYNERQKKIVTLLLNYIWKPAQPEDERDLQKKIKEKYSLKPENFNTLVGFINYEDKTEDMVFKVKDMSKKRNTGARCDQANKKVKITTLNLIYGNEVYTDENTKGVNATMLCCLEEFIMRYYNKIQKDGKTWFLDPDTAKVYKF